MYNFDLVTFSQKKNECIFYEILLLCIIFLKKNNSYIIINCSREGIVTERKNIALCLKEKMDGSDFTEM